MGGHGAPTRPGRLSWVGRLFVPIRHGYRESSSDLGEANPANLMVFQRLFETIGDEEDGTPPLGPEDVRIACLVRVNAEAMGSEPITVYLSLNSLAEQGLEVGSRLPLKVRPERMRFF